MKKTLLFSSALLAAMAANAQTWEAATVGEGDFYLYNVGAAKYMQGGNAWGTQISLHQGGQLVTLAAVEGENGETGYTIDSHISNGGASHFFGGGEYLDAAAAVYTFEPLEGGAYAIKAANGNYLYSENGQSLIKHSDAADLTSPNAQWKLVTREALIADMANASLSNPIDITPLIYCSGFGRNNTYIEKWNGEPQRGGANENMCGEKWNCLFDVNQVLEGMPAGNYKLQVQGFYRAGDPKELTLEGDVQNAILYVNDTEQPLISILSELGNITEGPEYAVGILPNSMAQASTAFTAGLYEQTLKFKLAEEGSITFGIKKDVELGNDWTIFDNFRLIYTGTPDFTAVSELAEQAKGLTAKHDVELDEELAAAISYAEQVASDKDEDNMEKAIEELQAIMDKVNASIAQYEAVKAAIEAADAKAAKFDAAGQAAYNEAIEWAKNDYENGECNFNEAGGNGIYGTIQQALTKGVTAQTTSGADMTAAIVNADFETGNLSGWDVVNAQWQNNNTYGAISRFAEKWVSAGNTLGDCSLTQTVTLGMGVYVLEADVVACQQGDLPEGETIVGMSLVAGDESVACSTGNGEATHYTVEFTAPYTQNSVELGFKVEGTNGNWWAVDNFKLTLKHVIIPEPDLAELYFDEYDAIDNGICTYAKDTENNNTTYSQMQPITEEGAASPWTIEGENGDARAAGIFEYGSKAFLGGPGYVAPEAGVMEDSRNALGLCAVWSSKLQYTRPYALEKGFYRLKAAVYNAGGTSELAKNLIGYIEEDGTAHYLATKKYAEKVWTEEEILFAITSDYSVGKLSAGIAAQNVGSGSAEHLFIDYITIEPISAAEYYAPTLAAAIAEGEAAVEGIEALEGNGVFMYAAGSAQTLNDAIEAAKALQSDETASYEDIETAMADIKAATAPEKNLPGEGELYAIKNSVADAYLNIEDGVKLGTFASLITFVATEGGYLLQSGENYVGMAGTNDWTMSNTEQAACAWAIKYIGEGLYTIKGPKGLIGTDNTAVGSACYGDKSKEKNGTWEIINVKDIPTAVSAAKASANDGAVYNLAGQKVGAGFKGIVIKDGKKMIQK